MSDPLELAEISAETLNSNFTAIENTVNAKAELNGDSTEVFNVANAVTSTEAVNKGQLDTAVGLLAPTVPANTTLHVATTGNDTTGDGTSSSPYATIAKALSYLNGKFLLGPITIQVADGTYIHTETLYVNHPQSNLISLIGNTTNPANCVLSFPNLMNGIYIQNKNFLYLNGVDVLGNNTLGSEGVRVQSLSRINIGAKTIFERFGINIHAIDNSCIELATGVISRYALTDLLRATFNAYIGAGNGATLTGNSSTKTTHGVYSTDGSYIHVGHCAISNCEIGCYADLGSYIVDYLATYANCTTNRSPGSNTVGNRNSYIAT